MLFSVKGGAIREGSKRITDKLSSSIVYMLGHFHSVCVIDINTSLAVPVHKVRLDSKRGDRDGPCISDRHAWADAVKGGEEVTVGVISTRAVTQDGFPGHGLDPMDGALGFMVFIIGDTIKIHDVGQLREEKNVVSQYPTRVRDTLQGRVVAGSSLFEISKGLFVNIKDSDLPTDQNA